MMATVLRENLDLNVRCTNKMGKKIKHKQMNTRHLKLCVGTDKQDYDQVKVMTTLPAHVLPGPGGLTTDRRTDAELIMRSINV